MLNVKTRFLLHCGITFALVSGLLAGPTVARAGEATVTVWPACGDGWEGEAFDDTGARVTFRACPVAGGGADSAIFDREGRPLSRVVQGEAVDTLIEIGGVTLLDRPYTEDELRRVSRVYESPDREFAGRLPVLLVDDGWDPGSFLVRALMAHGPIYEDRTGTADDAEAASDQRSDGTHPQGGGCTSKSTNCMGCCGIRCIGCFGMCTPECLEHDKCVADEGYAPWKCKDELKAAIQSIRRCRKCPEECKDGPHDCCGGEGPACVSIP